MKALALAAAILAWAPIYAHASSPLRETDPHAVLRHMGFALAATYCRDRLVNWLGHDLIFDWAEAKLGESVEEDRNKKHFIAGAEEADKVIGKGRKNVAAYCAELDRRFGDRGAVVRGLVTRR